MANISAAAMLDSTRQQQQHSALCERLAVDNCSVLQPILGNIALTKVLSIGVPHNYNMQGHWGIKAALALSSPYKQPAHNPCTK